MKTDDEVPGLGSGALREALESRLLQWRKIHASTKGQWRTNYEEGRDNMLMDCIEGLAADIQKFDSLLSLSSPIEPQRTPGEDTWLDEIMLVLVKLPGSRDKLRTILRAYRANLLAQPTQASSALVGRGAGVEERR